MLRIVRKHKPDVMIGTDIVIAHIGKLLGIPSIILNEDDAAAVPLFAKYGFPYCTIALAPQSTDVGSFADKHIQYPGYHELAYLHPDHFQPDEQLLKDLLGGDQPHFIIRAASLTAHHDEGRTGIDDELALCIIEELQPKGKVIISAERELGAALEPYRVSFHPKHLHHVLATASLYVGDSQTMAAEAAVLGVPSIRFNDFRRGIGIPGGIGAPFWVDQRHKNLSTRGVDALGSVNTPRPKFRSSLHDKRQEMLSMMINVSEFFRWFFLEFPESMHLCRQKDWMWKTISTN